MPVGVERVRSMAHSLALHLVGGGADGVSQDAVLLLQTADLAFKLLPHLLELHGPGETSQQLSQSKGNPDTLAHSSLHSTGRLGRGSLHNTKDEVSVPWQGDSVVPLGKALDPDHLITYQMATQETNLGEKTDWKNQFAQRR